MTCPRAAPRVVTLLCLLALAACDTTQSPGSGGLTAVQPGLVNQEPDLPWFVEAAAASGLSFTHANGMSGRFFYAEVMAPGVALFDYDNDGDLDVYFPQGQDLDESAPSAGASTGGRLFRNDLAVEADGTHRVRFTDVTTASGINPQGYGMGTATGDVNNDGCVDLYLTSLGPNHLYRNNCNGTFTDISRASGTADPAWSVSAAFVDYDRDGWLDLFVGNYLRWSAKESTPCFTPSGRQDYCSPNVYQPQASRVYHNNRDGTFADVTVAAGVATEFGPALGISTADVNGDGWPDIYVANDGQANQLWLNQQNGTFRNTGLLSGTALSAHGKAKAGMGVDAGDFDNDGDEDLFVTNLIGEGNDLYVNDGLGLFEEQSARSRLGFASRAYTGFGTAWFDIDNDGWLDLLVVNGAVQTIEALRHANDPFPLHQKKLLFRNLRNGTFEDVTGFGGSAFERSAVGRGAAFGDIDNDGDVDVVIATNNGRAELLLNTMGSRRHWIGLRLVGSGRPRDMLGTRVGVVGEDGRTVWRRARADGSYASANDPRVIVGLGPSTRAPRVTVVWPDGRTEDWDAVPVDRYTTLTEGTGQ